nr:transposase [Actinomyces sp. oral taxon 414]
MVDAEAAAVIGAQRYERTPQRTNRRNGTRPKTVATTAGEVELAIPKLRTGSFFPSLLHPRRRVDKAQMRGGLLRVDRGRVHAQGLATWSRPWATSPGSAAPRSQGSARTSTRACTSSSPAAWTTPGSPTCSWTPRTWT